MQWALSFYRDSEFILSIFSYCFAVCIVNHSVLLGWSRVIASLSDGASGYDHLRKIAFCFSFVPMSIYAFLAFTELGIKTLGSLCEIPQGKEVFIQNFFAMMVVGPIFTVNRVVLEGLCIQSKETYWVGEATLVRLVFSMLLCFGLGRYTSLSEGYLGGITLVGGIIAESVCLGWKSRHLVQRLSPVRNAPPLTLPSILKSWFPLYLSSLSWTLSYPIINRIIIENNTNPLLLDSELAGFGVLRSLVLTIGGPVYALTNATLSLYRNTHDLRAIRSFGIFFCTCVSALSMFFLFPFFQHWILQSIFHLDVLTIALSSFSLCLIPLYPWFTVFRSLSEGKLIKLRSFRIFVVTSSFRVLSVYATGELYQWSQYSWSGVTLGTLCLFVAAGSDWLWLSLYASTLKKEPIHFLNEQK